jgi:hypothetical protein
MCPNISGVYGDRPTQAKAQTETNKASLGIMVLLYTRERLNVPAWVRYSTAQVELTYESGSGLTIIVRGAGDGQMITRTIPASELACNDGLLRLRWNNSGHNEGTTHVSVSYLDLYRSSDGALVASDNLVDRASVMLVISSTTEHHDWFIFPMVAKP